MHMKLSVTNKLDGINYWSLQARETVCHSQINRAATLHNAAVRRWLRVFGYSSGSPCRNHPQSPDYK